MDKEKQLRLSFSSTSTYHDCPFKYKYQYIDKLTPIDQGASLQFGSAIDAAVMAILDDKDCDYIDIFLNHTEDRDGRVDERGWKFAFNNDKIFYTSNDFNSSILTEDDTKKIKAWELELKENIEDTIKAEKKKKYKKFNGSKLKLWSRCCWLSMYRLGTLMIDAFIKDILPNIKKVHSTQKKIRINLGETTKVVGYIDMICDYKNEGTIVFDLKTASAWTVKNKYGDDCIMLSDQLRIYAAAMKSNKVGYVVLPKFTLKTYTCPKCKKVKPKSNPYAKKCPTCNEFFLVTQKIKPIVKIGEYSDEDLKEYMEGFVNTAKLIKSGLFYKNYDSCTKFGMCAYYNLCHRNDSKGLKKKGEK